MEVRQFLEGLDSDDRSLLRTHLILFWANRLSGVCFIFWFLRSRIRFRRCQRPDRWAELA